MRLARHKTCTKENWADACERSTAYTERLSASHMTKLCKSPNVKVDILCKTKAISLIEKSMECSRNRGNKIKINKCNFEFFFF